MTTWLEWILLTRSRPTGRLLTGCASASCGVFVRGPEPKLYRSSGRYSRHDHASAGAMTTVDAVATEPYKVELLRFAPEPASLNVAGRLALAEGTMVLVTALRSPVNRTRCP